MSFVRVGSASVLFLSFACSGAGIDDESQVATEESPNSITATDSTATTASRLSWYRKRAWRKMNPTPPATAGAPSGAAGAPATGSGGSPSQAGAPAEAGAPTAEPVEPPVTEPSEPPVAEPAPLEPTEPEPPVLEAPAPSSTTGTSCFVGGTAAGTAMTLGLGASRVSGVAPLAVYFDTNGTTSTATSRPFHDLSYCWNFGDANSGTYSTTGLSKNDAKGPAAAHVFETPGTYTVTVSARDAQGRVATKTIQVTVQNPDQTFSGQNTVCVSPSANYSGCPTGALQHKASSLDAIQSLVATGKRILLHRGESFTSSNGLTINVAGPGTIGAYGSGDRPKILASATTFRLSDDRNPKITDWRVMDVNVEGQTTSSSGFWVGPNAKDITVLRTRLAKIGGGISSDISGINYMREIGYPNHDLVDRLTVQDSEIRDLVGGGGHNLLFVSGHRVAFLGNIFENSTGGEHVLRTPWLDRAVISSNRLGNAPEGRHVFKLHAPGFSSTGVGQGKYTEKLVISDNRFSSIGGHSWTIAACPQNSTSDERIRDVLFERNWMQPGPSATQISVCAQDVTIRDNLFNANKAICVEISQRGKEPVPTRVALTHNTCVTGRTSGATLIAVDPSVNPSSNRITAFSNLVVGSVSASSVANNTTASGNNLVAAASGLSGTNMDSYTSYMPASSSPAVDAVKTPGAEAMSYWDFSGRPRPVDGNRSGTAENDIGALERTP